MARMTILNVEHASHAMILICWRVEKKKKNLVPTFRKKTLYLQCHLPEDGVWFDGEWLLTLCLQQELFNRNFH